MAATALPLNLGHQGRLHDSSGVPLDGTSSLTFSLYTAPTGGASVWSETQSVDVDNGYYAVDLGTVSSIDPADLDVDALYLGVSIDGGAELSRVSIESVPFAFHALGVSGGVVNADSVVVGGSTIINSSGQINYSSITGAPSDSDTLAALTSCASGQHLEWSGSAWACGDKSDDAGDIVSGTFNIARIPVGTDSNSVARGNHTHSNLTVDGLKLTSAAGPCGSGDEGGIQYSSSMGSLQFCDGDSWKDMSPRPLAGSGTKADPYTYADGSAAISCRAYNEKSWPWANGNSAVYLLDDGASGYGAYCDQVRGGGGWTLVVKALSQDATLNRNAISHWRLKTYIGDITNTSSENGLGPSYEHVPFNDVMIRSLANPERNMAWHHGTMHSSMFDVVDAGVRITDGQRLYGNIENLDTPQQNKYYLRSCAEMKCGFMLADWNYNGGLGIAGHTGLAHGHTGAVIGCSILDFNNQMSRTYGDDDGNTTRCITDFGVGGGYYLLGGGDDLYSINAHWWGNGNSSTNNWADQGVFVR